MALDGITTSAIVSELKSALVGGRIVLTQILFDRNLLRLLILRRALLSLQDNVILDLLLDALLELHGGQLQQLNHLDLLRRELLLKRNYLFLTQCHRKKRNGTS